MHVSNGVNGFLRQAPWAQAQDKKKHNNSVFLSKKGKKNSHRALRGHREVGFTGRGVDGLVYTNSQPYSKRACAFGLRSLSKLLTLSALVKPEKSLFFLGRIAANTLGIKRHKTHKRDKKNDQKCTKRNRNLPKLALFGENW